MKYENQVQNTKIVDLFPIAHRRDFPSLSHQPESTAVRGLGRDEERESPRSVRREADMIFRRG